MGNLQSVPSASYLTHTLPFKLSPTVNMSGSDDNGSPGAQEKPEAGASEHLNIKVTDNNNEVFFKIKRTTQLKKLMDAFCERQGKAPNLNHEKQPSGCRVMTILQKMLKIIRHINI